MGDISDYYTDGTSDLNFEIHKYEEEQKQKENEKRFIKGHCTTMLDYYSVDTVKLFYKVPEKGDLVYCRYKGQPTTLKVCGITHAIRNSEPYIIVELHN